MEKLIKNRRFIWIAAVLLIGLYNAPSIVRILTPRHEEKPSPAIKAPEQTRQPATQTGNQPVVVPVSQAATQPTSPPPPSSATGDAASSPLLGIWHGEAMLAKKGGACALKLEIKPSADNENPFSGFTTLTCMQTLTMQQAHEKGITPAQILERMQLQMNPVTARLAGHPADGGIEFIVTKNMGLGEVPGSCPMTSLTATPFSEQLSVQWKESGEGACRGAEITLSRTK